MTDETSTKRYTDQVIAYYRELAYAGVPVILIERVVCDFAARLHTGDLG